MDLINKFSIPNLMRRRDVMSQLNWWSTMHLFVDTEDVQQIIIPTRNKIRTIHYSWTLVNLLRFLYFALGDRSDYMNFTFGNRFVYIGGSRFWSALEALMSAVYLGSHYVTNQMRSRSAYYNDIISFPMLDTLLEGGATVRLLLYAGDLCIASAVFTGLAVDGIPLLVLSVEEEMAPLTFLSSLIWTYDLTLNSLLITSSVIT